MNRLRSRSRDTSRRWLWTWMFPAIAMSAVSCGERSAAPLRSQSAVSQPGSAKSATEQGLFAAPAFRLTDQTGSRFGSAQLAGKVWVANFIFTHCTATCPKQTERVSELARRSDRWPDADRVRFISFTVDPERDTVPRLNEYAERHRADARWKFLTGTRDELWRVSKDGFRLPVDEAVRDTSNPFTHSAKFALVDAHSRIRGFYDSASDDECARLLVDLRNVLGEPSTDPAAPVNVAIPSDVFDPLWMEARRAEQLETKAQFTVPVDFEFTDRLPESGITFVSRVVADAARDFRRNHYDHGNGLVIADVDGDGFEDIYFLSQAGGNQLWRNLGDGHFEDVTLRAGVALAERVSSSAAFADTDNDGDPDLYVTTIRHGNVFFENLGKGLFRDATKDAGLAYVGHSSAADFFDYDRDGRLDLFVSNVGVFTTDEVGYSGDPRKRESPYFVGFSDAFVGHIFPGRAEPSLLYHNEGQNRFREVSQALHLVDTGWAGDATPIDANSDGWIDLYVLNMQGPDELYENIRGQRFEPKSVFTFPKPVWGGMAAKVFDSDNDGRLDLMVTNMHADMWDLSRETPGSREKQKVSPERVPPTSYTLGATAETHILGNALYRHRADGSFDEVADQVNAETFWPWGVSVGDLNADGFQDMFVTSSMAYPYRYHVNSLLLNDHGQFRDAEFLVGVEPRRDGKTAAPWFEVDCNGKDAGCDACQQRQGRFVAWGAIGSRSSVIFDLDHDGDLDIVTNDFNTPPQVLISNLSEKRPGLKYLKVHLEGIQSNRNGLGARVTIEAQGRTFTQVHDGQSGYLSQSLGDLYFGLGEARAVDRLIVDWPSGQRQELSGPIASGRRIVVREGAEKTNADR